MEGVATGSTYRYACCSDRYSVVPFRYAGLSDENNVVPSARIVDSYNIGCDSKRHQVDNESVAERLIGSDDCYPDGFPNLLLVARGIGTDAGYRCSYCYHSYSVGTSTFVVDQNCVVQC